MQDNKVQLHMEDCLEVLKDIEDAGFEIRDMIGVI